MSKTRARRTRSARSAGQTRHTTGAGPTRYTTRSRRKRSAGRLVLWVFGGAVALFIAIQFIPYGHDHSNPPATNPFTWTSQRAAAIAKAACYDCHSNETAWWWGIKIAPFSWLAQRDVTRGRSWVNFSDWTGMLTVEELQRALDGKMPPSGYTLMHPSTRLSAAEKTQLIDGFRSSLAVNQVNGGGSTAGSGGGSGSGGSTTGSGALSILNTQCGTCHGAPLGLRVTSAAEAQALIDQMVQQGASVTPAQEQALIAYFTR